MRKSVNAAVWLALCLVILGVHEGYATQFVSINDLYDDVQDGWRETYEAHGRTIVIDAEIIVPNVETCPIVELGFFENIQQFSDDAELYVNEKTMQTFVAGNMLNANHPTEDVQLPQEEIIRIFEGFLTQCVPHYGDFDLELVGIFSDPESVAIQGHKVSSRQRIKGIPVVADFYYTLWVEGEANPPMGVVEALIRSADDFIMSIGLAREVSVLAEDVPLLPFEQIKPEFEKWIKAGLIRQVYVVRFGYMVYYNPKSPTTSFYSIPVWILEGEILESYEKESQIEPGSFSDIYSRFTGGDTLIVEAQTGKLLDFLTNRDPARRMANEIITWDDVK